MRQLVMSCVGLALSAVEFVHSAVWMLTALSDGTDDEAIIAISPTRARRLLSFQPEDQARWQQTLHEGKGNREETYLAGSLCVIVQGEIAGGK